MKKTFQKNRNQKVLNTLGLLILYQIGNCLPLPNIDQNQLKDLLSTSMAPTAILQLAKLYSGSQTTSVSLFSLGITPYISASIFIDALTPTIPSLERLQSEEGFKGKQKLFFYKKLLAVFIASFQAYGLINSLQSSLYSTNFFAFSLNVIELITGALLVIWICDLIEAQGIVNNGTSLIILLNIFFSLIGQVLSFQFQEFSLLAIFFLICIIRLINYSQGISYKMSLISAKQLSYLEKIKRDKPSDVLENRMKNLTKNHNTLSIKFNQAGIFPLIFASNIFALLSSLGISFIFSNKLLETSIYYLLIVYSNYLYTLVFWNPEKISEQLRKSSVIILNKTPGKETEKYLDKVVKQVSLRGGFLLAFIPFIYDTIKKLTNFSLLNQINISSLIIAVGILNEIVKNFQSLGLLDSFQSYQRQLETKDQQYES